MKLVVGGCLECCIHMCLQVFISGPSCVYHVVCSKSLQQETWRNVPWLEVATPSTKAGWNSSDFACLWGKMLLLPVEPLDWCHPLGSLFLNAGWIGSHSHSCFLAIATQRLCVFTEGRGHRTSTLSGSHFPPCLSHCIVFYKHSLILLNANFERTQTPTSFGWSRKTLNIVHSLKSSKVLLLASFL